MIRVRWVIFTSSLVYLLVSLPGLYIDVLNTDGINWHTRSHNFIEALRTGKLESTYQTYHPGVTLMWISGTVLSIYSNLLSSQGYIPYSYGTYLLLDRAAKLSVIAFTLLLFMYMQLILSRLISIKALIVFNLLFLLEPFVIGQRRLYHLDYLMACLGFCAFITAFYNTKYNRKKIVTILTGLFFTLSVLTKSTGLLLLPILLLIYTHSRRFFMLNLSQAGLFILSVLITTYILVPALWINPVKNGLKIYSQVRSGVVDIGYIGKKEVGFSGSKENITLEEIDKNGDLFYYIKSTVYSLSPVGLIITCITLLALCVQFINKKAVGLDIATLFTLIIFLLPMSISNKKGIRYGVVFFPYLFLLTKVISDKFRAKWLFWAALFYIATLIPQYFSIYPYFYAYANPLLGGARARVEMFKPGSLGVGTYEVNSLIHNDYHKQNGVLSISGFKSLKVINQPGVVDTSFKCDSVYVVSYALDRSPSDRCNKAYKLLDNVKVGNINYWRIYKAL